MERTEKKKGERECSSGGIGYEKRRWKEERQAGRDRDVQEGKVRETTGGRELVYERQERGQRKICDGVVQHEGGRRSREKVCWFGEKVSERSSNASTGG